MPNRILVIRLSAVGDVINTLPALEALRRSFPRAFIGFAVEDRALDLIQDHPSVDRVHHYRRRRWVKMMRRPLLWGRFLGEFLEYVHDIRRQHYDVALDMQANFKGGMHGLVSGVPKRVGFARGYCHEMNYLLSTHRVAPVGGERINRVDKFLAMASFIGAQVAAPGYRLPEPEESRARIREFLVGQEIGSYVAIHPGTSNVGRLKRWMPERFSSLAQMIGRELDLRSVVTWGPGERELAEEVVASGGGHAVLGPETRNILDLAELIRRASLFVGCDSGPLHLSSAVSTPSVALFGPKDPRTYGPYNPRHRVVYKVDGGNGNGSMDAITVEDAFHAVSDLFSDLGRPPRRAEPVGS